MLFTRARMHLSSRWIYLGAGVAALFLLPNLLWQINSDWPSLEFYRVVAESKNVPTPPLSILWNQIGMANVGALPLWLAGLAALLFAPRFRTIRHLGFAYLILFGALIWTQQARPDRLLGMYPLLFAVGCASLDNLRRTWVHVVAAVPVIAMGLAVSLSVLPILPPHALAPYAQRLGATEQRESGPGKSSPVPQLLADRLGWENFVRQIVQVVAQLEPDELQRTAILAPSYGHAGALELLGPANLPTVISNHNSWFLWGPPDHEVEILIGIGTPRRVLDYYASSEQLDATVCKYCMAWRDNLAITISRQPRSQLADFWPSLKNFQ